MGWEVRYESSLFVTRRWETISDLHDWLNKRLRTSPYDLSWLYISKERQKRRKSLICILRCLKFSRDSGIRRNIVGNVWSDIFLTYCFMSHHHPSMALSSQWNFGTNITFIWYFRAKVSNRDTFWKAGWVAMSARISESVMCVLSGMLRSFASSTSPFVLPRSGPLVKRHGTDTDLPWLSRYSMTSAEHLVLIPLLKSLKL